MRMYARRLIVLFMICISAGASAQTTTSDASEAGNAAPNVEEDSVLPQPDGDQANQTLATLRVAFSPPELAAFFDQGGVQVLFNDLPGTKAVLNVPQSELESIEKGDWGLIRLLVDVPSIKLYEVNKQKTTVSVASNIEVHGIPYLMPANMVHLTFWRGQLYADVVFTEDDFCRTYPNSEDWECLDPEPLQDDDAPKDEPVSVASDDLNVDATNDELNVVDHDAALAEALETEDEPVDAPLDYEWNYESIELTHKAVTRDTSTPSLARFLQQCLIELASFDDSGLETFATAFEVKRTTLSLDMSALDNAARHSLDKAAHDSEPTPLTHIVRIRDLAGNPGCIYQGLQFELPTLEPEQEDANDTETEPVLGVLNGNLELPGPKPDFKLFYSLSGLTNIGGTEANNSRQTALSATVTFAEAVNSAVLNLTTLLDDFQTAQSFVIAFDDRNLEEAVPIASLMSDDPNTSSIGDGIPAFTPDAVTKVVSKMSSVTGTLPPRAIMAAIDSISTVSPKGVLPGSNPFLFTSHATVSAEVAESADFACQGARPFSDLMETAPGQSPVKLIRIVAVSQIPADFKRGTQPYNVQRTGREFVWKCIPGEEQDDRIVSYVVSLDPFISRTGSWADLRENLRATLAFDLRSRN